MPQSVTVPETTYAVGEYDVVLPNLPGNSTGARIRFSRTAQIEAASGALADVNAWMSRDNQSTWQHVMGVTLGGGVLTNRDGSHATESVMLFTWPGEAGPNGRVMLRGSDVKLSATVLQSTTTAITIESITTTMGV